MVDFDPAKLADLPHLTATNDRYSHMGEDRRHYRTNAFQAC
jgi:hypothetical protein